MLDSFFILTWYNPEVLFILLYGLPEGFQQGLCVSRSRNDPGMKVLFFVLRIKLAAFDQELEGVVPDFKVVGVSSLKLVAILGGFTFMVHFFFF